MFAGRADVTTNSDDGEVVVIVDVYEKGLPQF